MGLVGSGTHCIAFPFASSPGPGDPSSLGPAVHRLKLPQKVFRLDPKETFLTARSPWNGKWKLPGRSVSQKVVNGGVPVRVKDAAVARQRLLFPLGVWLRGWPARGPVRSRRRKDPCPVAEEGPGPIGSGSPELHLSEHTPLLTLLLLPAPPLVHHQHHSLLLKILTRTWQAPAAPVWLH